MMKFLLCLLFICFIAILQVFVFKEKIISKKGEYELHLLYGDIIKYWFDETDKKRIIVINVNTAFDTTVEKPNIIKLLVSNETSHGKWLEKK